MPEVYIVRANFGRYTGHFLRGEYAAIGWLSEVDLSIVKDYEHLDELYRDRHPNLTNALMIGQQVDQIAVFLFELKRGDFVITPGENSESVHYGTVESDYYYFAGTDGCPFRHRRKIAWHDTAIEDKDFSPIFRHTILSPLTIFQVAREKNNIVIANDELFFQPKS